MRYTRYDYKKKKGDNFIVWIIGSIVFSIIVGMLFYNLFLKQDNVVDKSNKSQHESVVPKVQEDNNEGKVFGIIQCGVFKDRNNAESTLASINSESTCFIVEEDGVIKLMYGIYPFDQAGEKGNSLTSASISNFRIKCKIKEDSDEKKAEAEIIEAYLKIINKLTEKDVKAVETKQFKEWVVSVSEGVNNGSEEFVSLVSEINQLPDEYKKENQKESLIQIYNILKKYKQK